jgi:hypothetical protein
MSEDESLLCDGDKCVYGFGYRETLSQMPHMSKVAKTSKTHWYGIISWANRNTSNGILETFNSIIHTAKSKGCKFSSTIKAIIYLLTGKVDFSKINPYCSNHWFGQRTW